MLMITFYIGTVLFVKQLFVFAYLNKGFFYSSLRNFRMSTMASSI